MTSGIAFSAFFGLCVGSFLNVVIARLPEGKSLGGRSRCLYCGKTVRWHDLIPIASFVRLGGKCRDCGREIGWRYPVIELATVLAFAGVFWKSGGDPVTLIWGWIAVSLLIALAGCDWRAMILPDILVFLLAAGAISLATATASDRLFGLCLTGGALALVFGILYVVSRGAWLGFGDVKLVFAIGVLFGYPLAIVAALGAIWSAAIAGLVLIAARRATLATTIPFGAFLACATLIVFIFHHDIATSAEVFFPR